MNTKHLRRYREVGRKVAFFRQQKNLSQQELADLVGISKSYISKLEAPGSERSFSLEVIFDISDCLGITLYELFKDIR
jgi:transcriptional regulator with XRE-family HTH domain